jgi:hypothetical protein
MALDPSRQKLMTLPASPATWISTGHAARPLGVSGESLRRWARSGVLEPGRHFRPGISGNCPWVWDAPACQARLLQLGAAREAAQRQQARNAYPHRHQKGPGEPVAPCKASPQPASETKGELDHTAQ